MHRKITLERGDKISHASHAFACMHVCVHVSLKFLMIQEVLYANEIHFLIVPLTCGKPATSNLF